MLCYQLPFLCGLAVFMTLGREKHFVKTLPAHMGIKKTALGFAWTANPLVLLLTVQRNLALPVDSD